MPGEDTIQFQNVSYVPDLDRIMIGRVVPTSSRSGAITRKSGLEDVRLWQLTLDHIGIGAARDTRLNSFVLAPSNGDRVCKATVLLPLPFSVGTIAPYAKRIVELPIAFMPSCRADDASTLHTVLSANDGVDMGSIANAAETR
jgi:hypothetical protein